MKWTALLWGMAAATGCNLAQVASVEVETENTDELSQQSAAFVTLERDLRKCAVPFCGGYWVSQVNRSDAPAVYVTDLNFSASGLDETAISETKNAPAHELLLKARLSSADEQGLSQLIVEEAYLGLPGIQVPSGSAFFEVAERNPPIQCFAAPCNNLLSRRLGSETWEEFESVLVERATKPWVQRSWLVRRMLQGRALVAGTLSVEQASTAAFKELVAEQLFFRLPEKEGPCPKVPEPLCQSGTAFVYTRSEDRCLVFQGCVQPGVCAQYMPICDEGYVLRQWPTAPGGCPAFACDPAFSVSP